MSRKDKDANLITIIVLTMNIQLDIYKINVIVSHRYYLILIYLHSLIKIWYKQFYLNVSHIPQLLFCGLTCRLINMAVAFREYVHKILKIFLLL